MAIATIAQTYPDTCTVTLAIAVCMLAVCTPCCNTVPGFLWLFCGTYIHVRIWIIITVRQLHVAMQMHCTPCLTFWLAMPIFGKKEVNMHKL